MATLSQNAETTGRVEKYREHILKLLQEVVAATPKEIEESVEETFGKDIDEDDRSVIVQEKTKRKIEKWRNDVHWARAALTRQHRTVNIGTFVVLAPAVHGNWEGVPLTDWREAVNLLTKLTCQLPDE